jgi:hypothetical protein
MKQRSITLQILWWTEIIVSLRVLLFFLPVLINQYITPQIAPPRSEDWGIVFMTFAMLLYLLTGVSSLMGMRLWRFFHVLSCAVVAVMTWGYWQMLLQSGVEMKMVYIVPLVIAVVITIIVFWQREPKNS